METIQPKPGLFTSFTRSQLSSLAATAVDFGSLVFLVEVLGVWYVAATAIGAFLGAVANFMLGRHWSFGASHGQMHGQAARYAVISGTSLLLNSAGVYFLTDHFGIQYAISKIITAFLVGILFNFPLHRAYVFR